MSWFETVVNTVKEVSKNFRLPTGLAHPSFVPICAGAPVWTKGNVVNSSAYKSEDIEHEIEDDEQDSSDEDTRESTASAARIATRARMTYMLDRFRKNAMLLFVQILSDPPNGCRNMDSTIRYADEIVETFTNFRFEVDIHVDLTCSDIDRKCQEFFQRDFRQYGAVVVVVLSFDGTYGKIAAKDGTFSESIIVRHLTEDLNPSLLGKPKIYITETNRTLGYTQASNCQYSLPIQEAHQDVLGLHIPAVYYGSVRQGALFFLCKNINEMADSKDFVTILQKAVQDATEANSMYDDFLPSRIALHNTFTKEMILARI